MDKERNSGVKKIYFPIVMQASATKLPYPDKYFDAVFTDPPYYDNVPYSYLSDFFYVWLKRSLGDIFPEIETPLTPKKEEIVAYTHEGGMEEAKLRFEGLLTESFKEIYRILKDDGIAVIVFAHKTTAAWESVINSLLKAGLFMTASWPIHTEMKARLRAKESAALASSIYMVCKKRTSDLTGEFSQVKKDIEQRIKQKLDQFWKEGIRGADFFMSAIGPAIEIFGKYSRVEKISGEKVSVSELLEFVHKVVAEFALERILENADLTGVDISTRFYLLWRWTYNHLRVHFDEANKLSKGMGVELEELWKPGEFVKKDKEYIEVLDPISRNKDEHFRKKDNLNTMIDVLHRSLILWENNDRNALDELLKQTYGNNDIFWQVAQAISEVLPEGDKEKQMIQGLLYSKQGKVKPSEKQLGIFGEEGER